MGKIYSGRHTTLIRSLFLKMVRSTVVAMPVTAIRLVSSKVEKLSKLRHASYSDQIGVIENGKVYQGRHTSSDQVGVIEENAIYGNRTSYSDQIGVVEADMRRRQRQPLFVVAVI